MKDETLKEIKEKVAKLNHKIEIIDNIKSGKEAVVYKVIFDDELVAMKVYKNPEERSFKNTGVYLVGKHYKKSSERKAVAKGNKFSKKLKYENWVMREFYMLKKMYDLGAQIPKPIFHFDNVVFMQLIGDDQYVAPRLCDIELTKTEAKNALKTIVETMLIFWHNGIVHADLSPYNILWWNNAPYIIDFPQAVDKRSHPEPMIVLQRDVDNVVNYFKKFIDVDGEEIKKMFS